MTMSLENEFDAMRVFSQEEAILVTGHPEAAQARHLYAVPDIELGQVAESLYAKTSLFGGKLLLSGVGIKPDRFYSGATAHYGVSGVAEGILIADKPHPAFNPEGIIKLPISGPGNVLAVDNVSTLPFLAAEIDSLGKPLNLRTSAFAEKVSAATMGDKTKTFAKGLQRGLRRFSWVIAGGELPNDPITVTHVDSLNSICLG